MRERFLCLLILVAVLSSGCLWGEKTVVTVAGVDSPGELDLLVQATNRFMERNPGIRVNVLPMPGSVNERLSSYLGSLEQGSDTLDVLQVDVVWPGILAEHAIDLKGWFKRSELERFFPRTLENNTIDGKLVALPWYIDLPVLYYRKDLLKKYGLREPPKTWTELEEMAAKIQEGERGAGNEDFWGYVWQGRPYEGLTCNALEWQVSNGGGEIVDSEGKVVLNNAESAEAISRASSWIARISPPEVISFDEEDSREVWNNGNAAFMRNWSYVYALSKANPDLDFGVTTLPAGSTGTAATLGGWQLMVSKHSKSKKAAVKVIRYLTSPAVQRRRAIEGSFAPTLSSLYQEEEVLGSMPFFVGIRKYMESAVRRPGQITGAKYDRVSRIYYNAVHDILNGSEASNRLARAEKDLVKLLAE